MQGLLIVFLFGLLLFVLGIVFLKRDKKLYQDAVTTKATLVGYYEYHGLSQMTTMYSMEVEYRTEDGTLIHAREQAGVNHQKYPVGTELSICYSRQKPELFLLSGSKERTIVLYGMMIGGMITMLLFAYMMLTY